MKSFKALLVFNILTLFWISNCASCYAQVKADTSKKKVIYKDSVKNEVSMPVKKVRNFPNITHDSAGMYPKYVDIVKGTIVAVSPLGFGCGVLCGCGTFKIHLNQDILLYPKEDIYLAVLCFNENVGDYLKKNIDLRVELVTLKSDCYTNGGFNCIDSKGVPFYIPAGEMKVY